MNLEDWAVKRLGAGGVLETELVQSLWSGYGQIVRLRLDGWSQGSTVIVKHIAPPIPQAGSAVPANPRGWSGDIAHGRKIRSYEVESNWYQTQSAECSAECRVPRCHAAEEFDGGRFLILEDLDAVGFDARHGRLTDPQLKACLSWLAHFHAAFLGQEPVGLWPIGTYWHLATRPDEFAAMNPGPLKDSAAKIDEKLYACEFKTFVHGDAKVANFCFDNTMGRVAAVDFQYVGGGCGMKDVAYFLGSCLSDEELSTRVDELLSCYFDCLVQQVDSSIADAVVGEWTDLFPWAWADFHRFLEGWCSTHPKLTDFSHRMVQSVLDA